MKHFTDRSATVEHTWIQDHPINWSKTRVLDCAAKVTELCFEGGTVHPDDHLLKATALQLTGMKANRCQTTGSLP